MKTNNHQIIDYSAVLEKKYGKHGTEERTAFDEEAYSFYTGQIIHDVRKSAKVTQAELAQRIDANKSYISKIEHGIITPSAATFYRIINALGCRVEIVSVE